MAEKIKQQMMQTTSILDPYGNSISFVKKMADNA